MTATPTVREVDRDPLQRMRSYQLASDLRTIAWDDAEALREDLAAVPSAQGADPKPSALRIPH